MKLYFMTCLLIFLHLPNTVPEVWNCSSDKKCNLSNTTWKNCSATPTEGSEEINLNFVIIPDSSLECFTYLLSKVKSFIFYCSAARRLHLPTGLIKLDIHEPVLPIEIVINQNAFYRLKILYISKLEKFPPEIAHLRSIEYFWCRSIPTPELDFELFVGMVNLTTMTMMETSTKDIIIPESLQLKALRTLTIIGSFLTTMNATSWNFPSLIELVLSDNNFTKLPTQIATFKDLISINMERNQIKFIDMQMFAGMQRLIALLLADNHISRIVGDLQLPRLSELRLDYNHLTELNVTGWHLPALTHINLSSNRLKSVIGFTTCFGRAKIIHLHNSIWDCTWLEEIGRSIKGMVIWYNPGKLCYAYRVSMNQKSVIMIEVNGTTLVQNL